MITLAWAAGTVGMPVVRNLVDGRELLVQVDYDFPGIASTFGWAPSLVSPYPFAERCDHDGTDGTIDCPTCGLPALAFINLAYHYIRENIGKRVEDPGYFTEDNA